MQLAVSIILVKILLGFDLCSPVNADVPFPRVNTSLGVVEGYFKTSNNGRQYEAYEGIPYAQPPTGKLRFKVAETVLPWTGVFKAKQFGPVCMRYNPLAPNPANTVEGSEDCLYLNIYNGVGNASRVTVNGKSTNLLPVIVYIHGGAFRFGSGSAQGPKYLLDRNVTLVTINFRVGPLGFLSTEDDIILGNMGLKDQVLALRWINKNIKSFGGDPSKVTIFGDSSGGSSVHLHLLSNLTTGLFHGGMSLSGTAFNSWAQSKGALEKAKKVGSLVGCPTNNVNQMVKCMRGRPPHQIVQTVGEFTPSFNTPISPFGPVVEKGSSNFTFIDRSPVDIITSGDAQDLPWITGVVSEEGLTLATAFIANQTLLARVNNTWDTIAPYLLDYNYTIPTSNQTAVSESIKKYYLGTSEIDRSTVNQTVQLIGDRWFTYHAGEAAKLHSQFVNSSVLFYYFTYRGAHSFSEARAGTTNYGVAHMDDLAYVLDMGINTVSTSQDLAMQKKLLDLWVSFATNSTPNLGVKWSAVNGSLDALNYLHIAGPDDIGMNSSVNFGQVDFWESLGFQENNCTASTV